jgi:hypothetical protein
MDIYNIFYMEHHAATATRTGSLKRSSSFKKLLKLPIWGSGETILLYIYRYRVQVRHTDIGLS